MMCAVRTAVSVLKFSWTCNLYCITLVFDKLYYSSLYND